MSDTDYLAEDYRCTADLLRDYARRDQRELFRAVCSNNLNIILAALRRAEAVASDNEALDAMINYRQGDDP